jgi:Xaa-Pro aminopeptidase
MTVSPPLLHPISCRSRQETLRSWLRSEGLDAAVFFDRHYVHALTGYWHEQPLTPTAVLVRRDGGTSVVSHFDAPFAPAADEVIPYVTHHLFTLKENLQSCVAEALRPYLAGLSRIGTDQVSLARESGGPAVLDITTDYQYLRRHKDSDEVALLKFTIACADRAYATSQQMIEPGINEVSVMAAMQHEATEAAGEFLSGWGQDFQSGSPGGFARCREVEAGELYVLDIGVGVRGYRSDLCRTFSVDGSPTQAQQDAHARIVEVMKMGEGYLRPGQSCREMHAAVHRELDGWCGHSFFHHAGHGIGLDAHEVPRINPAWDDTFAEGDVVAFEPGLYGESLRAGIRLENNYLITTTGFEKLSFYPLDLVPTAP